MKKDLIIQLVKVANNLDEMGFSKEANRLDKIARKVISLVAVPKPEYDYTKDIQTYKKLLYENPNNNKPAQEFLNKVNQANYLTTQQTMTFNAQVERLIHLSKLPEDQRSEINEKIYKTVKNYDLDKPDIDETTFEKNWTNSKLNKVPGPGLDTYNILKSRFRTPLK